MVIESIPISKIVLPQTGFRLDMLRLDLIHPLLSGNKYFKLKYNIENALHENKNTILTVGGAYSNHLHATAYACKQNQLNSIGLIPNYTKPTCTIQDCINHGMQIESVAKALLHDDIALSQYIATHFPQAYYIPMGGDNEAGRIGAAEITNWFDAQVYNSIYGAVGTGTTLEGITQKLGAGKVCGIAAVKDFSLAAQFNFSINFDYTFGGFGKYNTTLIDFIKAFYALNNIVLDFVYTAKLMFGINEQYKKNQINSVDKLLCLHTGGLQGNRSIIALEKLKF